MTEEGFQEAVAALRVTFIIVACGVWVHVSILMPKHELRTQALIGEGQAAQALAALESLQAQAIPPATIYDEVFGCCAASGEWEAHAQSVLGHAATAAEEGGPTLVTFQAALDAIHQGMRTREGGEKGEWAKRAVRVYEAMVEAGVMPDGRAVEGVLSALAQVCVFVYARVLCWQGGALKGAQCPRQIKTCLARSCVIHPSVTPPPPQAGRQEEALALIHQATTTLHVPSTKYWYRIVLGSFFRRANSGGGGGGNGGSGRRAYSSPYPGPDYKVCLLGDGAMEKKGRPCCVSEGKG